MAASSFVFTIDRVAEMLGEDVDELEEIALEMEPEDGRLTVWGTGDQSTTAFTRNGVEYLQQLLEERKDRKNSRQHHARGAHRMDTHYQRESARALPGGRALSASLQMSVTA